MNQNPIDLNVFSALISDSLQACIEPVDLFTCWKNGDRFTARLDWGYDFSFYFSLENDRTFFKAANQGFAAAGPFLGDRDFSECLTAAIDSFVCEYKDRYYT